MRNQHQEQSHMARKMAEMLDKLLPLLQQAEERVNFTRRPVTP
jgi:hypothetical protein